MDDQLKQELKAEMLVDLLKKEILADLLKKLSLDEEIELSRCGGLRIYLSLKYDGKEISTCCVRV